MPKHNVQLSSNAGIIALKKKTIKIINFKTVLPTLIKINKIKNYKI